jgi:hypothetical protein
MDNGEYKLRDSFSFDTLEIRHPADGPAKEHGGSMSTPLGIETVDVRVGTVKRSKKCNANFI